MLPIAPTAKTRLVISSSRNWRFSANYIESNLALKHVFQIGYRTTVATHCSSKTEHDEAFMAGQAAVKAAIDGETDKMVILVRVEGDTYEWRW